MGFSDILEPLESKIILLITPFLFNFPNVFLMCCEQVLTSQDYIAARVRSILLGHSR